MAELLKGAPVARALTEELAARCVALRERGVVPTLAIVRVGEREDDLSYERGALKRCEKVGIEARRVLLPADVSQDELLAAIEDINTDSSVHGCLMFRPLPAGLDEDAVAAALDPAKDVDSMTPASLLTTLSGRGEGFAPCTAEAVLALLDHYGVELDGAKVAVVGRSLVIGRPVAAMLTARNATVTTCHTHTRDLAAECRAADIVVAAVGRARTIGADAVREGQTIIDVGINWDEAAGKLVGDVDFDAAEPIVGSITPVPGGVGAVTTAILAKHVIEAAERAGFENIKLNCVLLGGMNDDEIGDFVRLTAKKPWQVRFIELMPMGVCAAWPPERFLPAQEVLSRVPELRPAGRSGVAQLYRLPGAAGTVGLIEPMSCAFCADCTRIRITADGKLKPCLHSDAELALRGLSGAELEAAIRQGILMKPARHRMDETGVTETHRGMFAIGG